MKRFAFFLLLFFSGFPGKTQPPGVVIDRSPDPQRIFIGSPSLSILPDLAQP